MPQSLKDAIVRCVVKLVTIILRHKNVKQVVLENITNGLAHAKFEEKFQDLFLKTITDERIAQQLWKNANVRPRTHEHHWAQIPNDIREERMRQATVEAAQFVQEHMPHLQSANNSFKVLDTCLDKALCDGLYLEFGVFSGSTINYIAQRVNGIVHGFDSFQGIPEQWGAAGPGFFSTNGQLPEVRENVLLHVGWFEDTIAEFLKQHDGAVSFVHIDSDLYSSARTVLWGLKDRFVTGSIILFDEFFNYPYWREHEYKAFREFVREFHLKFNYIAFADRGYSVAIEVLELNPSPTTDPTH